MLTAITALLIVWGSQKADQIPSPSGFSYETEIFDLCEIFYKNHLPADTISKPHIYRFVWLRSFHKPVIFQLIKTSELEANLTIAIIDRKESDSPCEKHSVSLSSHQIKTLDVAIEKVFSWSGDSKLETKKNMADGAQWCFELKHNSKFFSHCRQSPQAMSFKKIPKRLLHQVPDWRQPDADFHALGMEFIKLSNVDLRPIY